MIKLRIRKFILDLPPEEQAEVSNYPNDILKQILFTYNEDGNLYVNPDELENITNLVTQSSLSENLKNKILSVLNTIGE